MKAILNEAAASGTMAAAWVKKFQEEASSLVMDELYTQRLDITKLFLKQGAKTNEHYIVFNDNSAMKLCKSDCEKDDSFTEVDLSAVAADTFNHAIVEALNPEALKRLNFKLKKSGRDLIKDFEYFISEGIEIKAIDVSFTIRWKSVQKTYVTRMWFDNRFMKDYTNPNDIRRYFVKNADSSIDTFMWEKEIGAKGGCLSDVKVSYSFVKSLG